ncbi:MAG: FAD-dependent oxidoreductase [Deltaproteobacteria bacterium]|nr:FAD-dependent oxidoreductase [Deltaproteobacteria bacterium]
MLEKSIIHIPQETKFLILGAGPTGLGAAYRLKELGIEDFIVLERENRVGGLATSYMDPQGFTWDLGGHIQFSHYKYFDQLMEKALGKDGWLHHERESWIWYCDRFIPYPFQNNLRYLPRQQLWEALKGLIEAKQNRGAVPHNFQQWLESAFGESVACQFMIPYNTKVWAHPLTQLSYDWVGDRVSVVDWERALKNVLFEKDDVSWGPNNKFQFPKRGGTGAIWQAVADLIGHSHIALNSQVVAIQSLEKTVTLGSGEKIKYHTLLNTAPLDTFCSAVTDFSPAVKQLANRLQYSSSNIVGIGLEGPIPEPLVKKCWMYFPAEQYPFYRVTVFSNYSPYNVPNPQKQWSLMAEVSESGFKPVLQDTVVQDVITAFEKIGFINGQCQIVSRWSHRCPHGYPIPSLDRNELLREIHPILEKHSMHSRGRFGGWKYEVSNQDHSVMQGVEWVDWIVLGVPELTYPHPNEANSGVAKESHPAPLASARRAA